MTIIHGLLPVARAAALAVSISLSALPAWAQSDETCIAYMEADAAYTAASDELDREIERRIGSARSVNDLLKINPGEARARLKLARRQAYLEAYRGPTSSIKSVMDKVLRADRRRCRMRFRG